MRAFFTKFSSFKESLILVILIPIVYWTLVDIIFFLYRSFEDKLNFTIATILILLSIVTSISAYILFPILLIIQISKAQFPYINKPLKIFFAIWMSFIYVLHFQPILEDMQFLEKNKAIVSDVSEYLKASRNYQVEFGLLAKSTIDLGNYAEIKGCEKTNYEFCKSVPSVDYSKTKKDSWYSRLGNYLITIKNGNQPISNEKYLLIKATPTQKKYSHLTIQGCHYFLSGKLKIKETDYFMNINPILLLRYFNLYKIPFKNYSNNYCSLG